VSQFSTFAVGSKKLADGKSWQNPRDELQNIELYQSSAKALHKALPKLCQKPYQKPYQKLYQRLCNILPTQYTGHALR
jgi:hypothetical protein